MNKKLVRLPIDREIWIDLSKVSAVWDEDIMFQIIVEGICLPFMKDEHQQVKNFILAMLSNRKEE